MSLRASDVLDHARLRVRPVEDGELGARVALLQELCDLRDDQPRLGVLVLDLEDPHGLALPQLAPERLRLALAVVDDHRVGGLEDPVRGAVVLLERDHLHVAEVLLELEDVADVGARGTRRSTGRDRRRRRRSAARRRGAAAAGTARGSCPGTRRRGCSGTPSTSAPCLRKSSSTSTVCMSRSSKSIAFASKSRSGRARRRRPPSGRRTRRPRSVLLRGHERFLAFEICAWMPRGRESLRVTVELLQALLDDPTWSAWS